MVADGLVEHVPGAVVGVQGNPSASKLYGGQLIQIVVCVVPRVRSVHHRVRVSVAVVRERDSGSNLAQALSDIPSKGNLSDVR
jgi:hypothetical protein